MTNTAKFLKERRTQLGLTQAEIAKKLGYSCSQYISNMERAQCHPPAKDIKKLSKILRVNSSTLIAHMVGDYRDDLERICDES